MIDVRDKNFGQVFTPPKLVDITLEQLDYKGKHILGKKILEPSFGDGAFLEEIVKRIIEVSPKEDLKKNLECIYGWELDQNLFNETLNKLNDIIKDLNIKVNWNLECTNSIYKMSNYKGLLSKANIKFDYIVGNPPYIIKRNIDKDTKKYIETYYNYSYNNYDLYYAFFELALVILKDSGKIAFITPSTYFYNYSAIKLRHYLVSKKLITKIIDFKRHLVFKDIWTFVAISVFEKNYTGDRLEYLSSSDDDPYSAIQQFINYKDLDYQSWSFNGDDNPNMGKELDEIVNIYQGLNTQRDKILMVKIEEELNGIAIVSNKFDKKFKIEKSILKEVIKISKQASIDGKLQEYLIFPYHEKNKEYSIMHEDLFKNKYPLAYNYLYKYKDLLDKRPYKNWYAANDGFFKSISRTYGKKIIFSYVMDAPNKFHYRDDDKIYYSGFIIKIKDNNYSYNYLLNVLNSSETWNYFSERFTTIKTGWSRVKLNIVKAFKV